jgi:cell division protein FtsW
VAEASVRGAAQGRISRAQHALRSLSERPLTSWHLILGITGVLTGLGVTMVLSASSIDSLTRTGNPYTVFEHQLVYCAVGAVAFAVFLRLPPQRLRTWSPWLLLVSLVGLGAVLVPGLGSSVAGAQKWFVLGGVSLQPSEPAKVALVLWGAHILSARRRVLHQWRRALLPVVPVALLVAGLVVLQPDLGSAICVVIILFALLLFAGVPARLLALLGAGALGSVVLLAVSASYRMQRLTSFLSPDTADPLGPGYQTRQALYSLADGGLLGAGLGQGTAQWSYLPNASNDFIFAIIGEQLGFVGAAAVLALFGLLAYTGIRIAARRADDPWTALVVATLTVWLVTQAAINIGYVLGLLPVTGITLPLISSGGSSVVVTMAALGIMASAARGEPAARASLRGPTDRWWTRRPGDSGVTRPQAIRCSRDGSVR